ncbi:MAG: hypothetical protein RR295_03105 [Oscillospiraceae bacterium]
METKNINPAKGLRMLRTANILSIIAIIIAIVGGVIMLMGAAGGASLAAESGGDIPAGAVGTAGIGALIGLVGLILVLVSSIMQIVGLAKTANAHSGYKTAMMLVLAGFLVSACGGFLPLPEMLSSILNIVSPVINFFVIYFVITATAALLIEKSNQSLADGGIKVRTTYLVCTAILVAAELAALLPALATAFSMITLVASLVQLVALFRYIGFLGNAATALGE